MTRAHAFITAASFACCLSVTACGESSSTADVPTEQEYNDVAKSFGNVVAADGNGGDVSSIHDASDLAIGVVPFGFAVNASGEFNGNRLGLEYTYEVSCKDVNGGALDVCDEDTTDAADVSVAWSGELALPPTFMASVQRSGNWKLTNIQSGTASLNGDSTFDFDASFNTDAQSREYHFSYTGTYDEIRIQHSPKHIVGGTVHYDISADRRVSGADGGSSSSSFRIDAVLTFDAEGHATFVLDGTHTYDLDVATGNVTLRASSN